MLQRATTVATAVALALALAIADQSSIAAEELHSPQSTVTLEASTHRLNPVSISSANLLMVLPTDQCEVVRDCLFS